MYRPHTETPLRLQVSATSQRQPYFILTSMLDSTNFQATDRLLKLDIYLVGKVEISPGSYLMALHLSYRQTAHISMVTIVTSFFIPDRTSIQANDRSLKLNLSSVGDLEYSPFMPDGTTSKLPADRWSSKYVSWVTMGISLSMLDASSISAVQRPAKPHVYLDGDSDLVRRL
jgi:hypothetical protein